MPILQEEEKSTRLVGSPDNPAREPQRKMPKEGRGSMGDKAFMDAVIIVGIAWLFLLFLAWSLRHHNV